MQEIYNGFLRIERSARNDIHQRLGIRQVAFQNAQGFGDILFYTDAILRSRSVNPQTLQEKLPFLFVVISPVAISAGSPVFDPQRPETILDSFLFESYKFWLSAADFSRSAGGAFLALLIVAIIANYRHFLSRNNVVITSETGPPIAELNLHTTIIAADQNCMQSRMPSLSSCCLELGKFPQREPVSLRKNRGLSRQDRRIPTPHQSVNAIEQAGIQVHGLKPRHQDSVASVMSRQAIMDAYVHSRRRLIYGRNRVVEWSKEEMRSYRKIVKPAMERISALLALVVLLPLMAALSIAIAVDSPGPIFFRQTRIGYRGKQFTILKFRTMFHCQPQAQAHQTWKDDPRVTYLGRHLRRMSLDELPQLVNVVFGEMSLVGPRPLAEDLHRIETPNLMGTPAYERRYDVRPGITGWAQIHGLRGAIRTEEDLRDRIEFDNYYIENESALLDLKILAYTPRAVLNAENAF